MSTRCRIAIENENGKVMSIYCHHDGYPQGNGSVGQTLLDYYKDKDKINKLMELGDLSRLGTEPVKNPWEDFPRLPTEEFMDYFSRTHPRNMCDYYSTRGEAVPAYVCSEKQLLKDFKNSDQEYLYLFKNGEWRYIAIYDNEFKPIPKDKEGEKENV